MPDQKSMGNHDMVQLAGKFRKLVFLADYFNEMGTPT